jgi:2-keto-4-pentenoate hydratase/2-oxohepta-3-ene-1,7-dioic acid hydratase in catechol pathway
MRLVRYLASHPGAGPRLGALVDGDAQIVDLQAARVDRLVAVGAYPSRAEVIANAVFSDTLALIEAGPEGLALAREVVGDAPAAVRVDAGTVRLLAPLIPARLRDFIAFEAHMRNWLITRNNKEIPPEYYKIPVYYKGNPRTVVGPDDVVPWPAYSESWDYELELGVVLRSARADVPADGAEGEIFGLTCFNDFSARDVQDVEIPVGLGPAKAKDFATGIGPCLVTMDEIGDLYDIDMRARVNGELWSEGNTRDIHWRFGQMIERMSAAEPLVPGELFGSGTIANGCGLELGRFLQDGDEVEIEVDGVGRLRNRVVRGGGAS